MEDVESRISVINDALDDLWETSTKQEKLAVLVSLLAARYERYLMFEMQMRG